MKVNRRILGNFCTRTLDTFERDLNLLFVHLERASGNLDEIILIYRLPMLERAGGSVNSEFRSSSDLRSQSVSEAKEKSDVVFKTNRGYPIDYAPTEAPKVERSSAL